MFWKDVVRQYDNKWLVVEAINAESKNGMRLLHEVSIVDIEKESSSAYKNTKVFTERPRKEKCMWSIPAGTS